MNALAAYQTQGTAPASESVRVARMLGLRKADDIDRLELADLVSGGLSVRAAEAIGKVLNLIGPAAIHALVSEPTLRRARIAKKPLSRDASERLYEMGRVLDQCALVFQGDAGQIERFMNRPNPMLGGRTPFAVAKASSAGAHAVIALLAEAAAGVAA